MADEDALGERFLQRLDRVARADLAESDRLRDGARAGLADGMAGGAIGFQNGAPGGGIRQRAGLRLGERR